jgi:hypothetical protein
LFGSAAKSLSFPQPIEVLGGDVHFHQHIDHEAKDGLLHSWGMAFS